jgi:hypothetical protein
MGVRFEPQHKRIAGIKLRSICLGWKTLPIAEGDKIVGVHVKRAARAESFQPGAAVIGNAHLVTGRFQPP